ncbi:MAG: neutral zinc metallopeptidase [Actinomycetota bacterium]|nr:neutral zinc metallopeptidase [Actinomycetota bacterium]
MRAFHRLLGIVAAVCVLAALAPAGVAGADEAPPGDPGGAGTGGTAAEDADGDAPDTADQDPGDAGSASDLPYDEIIERGVVSVEAFWAQAMPAVYGVEYQPLAALVPWDPEDVSTLPDCGGSQPPPSSYVDNAFYCPADDYIGWDDTGLFPRLYEDFGDATIALVLAHEWGHAIQFRLGIPAGTPTILLELQADCFAGAWSATAMPGDAATGDEPLLLPQSDVDEAIGGYVLFRDPPGSDPLGPNAHGSAFDRIGAFRDGFVGGVERCATFMTDGYAIAAVELIEADLETGGNVALDELFDELVPPDLEDYWTINAPDLLGVEWDPTDGFRAVESGTPATCGDEVIEPARLALDVVWCAADDTIVWDRGELVEPLYEAIGDFAVASFLGNAWAHKALVLAGVDADPIEMELRSDCLTGAWASDLWRRERTSPELPPEEWTGYIGLSAGDLDEGVAGLLAVQDPEVARLDVTAFARVDAFRIGFFSPDPSECVAD